MKADLHSARRRRGLILAAGVGSRLRPLTDRMPKCLVPVGGRPLLDYWVDALIRVGVRDVWINSHAHAEQVRSYIARHNKRECGVRLHECHEPVLLGSAGTVAANRDVADGADEIVVVYADNFSVLDLRQMLRFHAERGATFTMALFEATNPSACGIAELDDTSRIVDFVEKPAVPRSNLANAGIYVLSAAAYREVADLRAFDFGFDVIPRFVGRMHGFRHMGHHVDIGTPDAFMQACAAAADVLAPLGQTPDGRRRAVFVFRDGALLERTPRPDGVSDVRLVAACGPALRMLRDAGFALVAVASPTARERPAARADTESRIHARMFDLLAAAGVTVDAVWRHARTEGSRDPGFHPSREREPDASAPCRLVDDLGLAMERSYVIGARPDEIGGDEYARCVARLLVGARCGTTPAATAAARQPLAFPGLDAAAAWIVADATSAANPSWHRSATE